MCTCDCSEEVPLSVVVSILGTRMSADQDRGDDYYKSNSNDDDDDDDDTVEKEFDRSAENSRLRPERAGTGRTGDGDEIAGDSSGVTVVGASAASRTQHGPDNDQLSPQSRDGRIRFEPGRIRPNRNDETGVAVHVDVPVTPTGAVRGGHGGVNDSENDDAAAASSTNEVAAPTRRRSMGKQKKKLTKRKKEIKKRRSRSGRRSPLSPATSVASAASVADDEASRATGPLELTPEELAALVVRKWWWWLWWWRGVGRRPTASIVRTAPRLFAMPLLGVSCTDWGVCCVVAVSYTHLTLPTKRIV